ncbi:MAG: SRPBCC family protein [Chitinivibrionales bacterium]|nr:SRPBCC family protein [Chitinivibrionales bacterium]
MEFSTTVSTSSLLSGIYRKETAWQVITDLVSYPAMVNTVSSVEIIERTTTPTGISSWLAYIEDTPLCWIQKETYDCESHQMHFESIDGDFEFFGGTWNIGQYKNEGIFISLSLRYRLGIPVIEDVIGSILEKKMQHFVDTIVHAISDVLKKRQVEERRNQRRKIGKYVQTKINDHLSAIHLINISETGLMFHSIEPFDENVQSITLFDTTIPCSLEEYSARTLTGRLKFAIVLDQDTITEISEKSSARQTQSFIGAIVHETEFSVQQKKSPLTQSQAPQLYSQLLRSNSSMTETVALKNS